MQNLMTIEEVSEYLHVARGTLYGWISRRSFPRKKVGRLIRFSRADVDAWVAEQTTIADNEALAIRNAHPRLYRHDPEKPVVFTLE